MIKTAIVILNWNGKEFLRQFLPEVIRFSNDDRIRIFVADNASSDDSVPYIQKNHPEVNIIQLDRNYGFAEGYNRALATIESEYYVLLNSDVMVTKDWLKPMLEVMESDPLVGACMPKIKAYHQPDFFEYAGAAGGFIDRLGYTFCQGRIFDSIENDFGQYDTVREIFWASGACFMIRGHLYHVSGGLDPVFFAHMEEVDLCWRLKNRGYKIMIVPGSVVYHVGGGTLPKDDPLKTYLNYRNNLYLLYKNLPDGKVTKTLIARFFMDYISSLRFLFRGSLKNFFAIPRAYCKFISTRKYCSGFRENERKFIISYSHRQIYRKSIVVAYFLRRKFTFKALRWIIKHQ